MWVFQYFMFSAMSLQSGLAFFVWNSVRAFHLGLNAIESLGIKPYTIIFLVTLALGHLSHWM